MLIDVRCQHCNKLLLQMTQDSTGVVRVKCRHCTKINDVSIATVIKQIDTPTGGTFVEYDWRIDGPIYPSR